MLLSRNWFNACLVIQLRPLIYVFCGSWSCWDSSPWTSDTGFTTSSIATEAIPMTRNTATPKSIIQHTFLESLQVKKILKFIFSYKRPKVFVTFLKFAQTKPTLQIMFFQQKFFFNLLIFHNTES